MYVDFSHDDILLSVLTALNYTQVVGEFLDPASPNPDRTFYLSHITPFAARIVFEVVGATVRGRGPSSTRRSSRTAAQRVVPQEGALPD